MYAYIMPRWWRAGPQHELLCIQGLRWCEDDLGCQVLCTCMTGRDSNSPSWLQYERFIFYIFLVNLNWLLTVDVSTNLNIQKIRIHCIVYVKAQFYK